MGICAPVAAQQIPAQIPEVEALMGEIITTISESDRPLCPNSTNWPFNEAHQLRNRVLDAFYNKAEKDAEGEMVAAADKPYNEAAYGASTTDRMNLFRHQARFMAGGQFVTVESWWFRCGICGMTLPAQRATH